MAQHFYSDGVVKLEPTRIELRSCFSDSQNEEAIKLEGGWWSEGVTISIGNRKAIINTRVLVHALVGDSAQCDGY